MLLLLDKLPLVLLALLLLLRLLLAPGPTGSRPAAGAEVDETQLLFELTVPTAWVTTIDVGPWISQKWAKQSFYHNEIKKKKKRYIEKKKIKMKEIVYISYIQHYLPTQKKNEKESGITIIVIVFFFFKKKKI
jgi:hypothetical protein